MDVFISAASFQCCLFFSDHLRGFKPCHVAIVCISIYERDDRPVFLFHFKVLLNVCQFVIGMVCQKESDSNTHTLSIFVIFWRLLQLKQGFAASEKRMQYCTFCGITNGPGRWFDWWTNVWI